MTPVSKTKTKCPTRVSSLIIAIFICLLFSTISTQRVFLSFVPFPYPISESVSDPKSLTSNTHSQSLIPSDKIQDNDHYIPSVSEIFNGSSLPLQYQSTLSFRRAGIEVHTSSATGFVTCRVHGGVCIEASGILHVHTQLHAHEGVLRNKCELPSFKFRDPSQVNMRKLDLFDISRIDPHIPHFVRFFLKLPYAMLQMSPSQIRRKLSDRNDTTSCYIPNSDSPINCTQMMQHEDDIGLEYGTEGIAVNLSHKVMMRKSSYWSVQLFRLLQQQQKEPMHMFLFSTETLFPKQRKRQKHNKKNEINNGNDVNIACFSSFTTTSFLPITSATDVFTDNHPFFRGNDIRRSAVLPFPSSISSLGTKICPKTLNLVYLTRKNGERDLRNYPLSFPFQSNSSSRTITTSVQSFENISISAQISVMQNTHILIAAHGAALANLMFARAGTRLLEVVPFFHVRSTFSRFARTFDVVHDIHVAFPDDESFKKCIREASLADETNILDIWNAVRNGTSSADSQDDLNYVIRGAQNIKRRDRKITSKVRVCARKQHLQVNPKYIVRWVERTVSNMCSG